MARKGDRVSFPEHGDTTIVEGNPNYCDRGVPVAFHGHKCGCGCTHKALLRKMDSDNSGDLSGEELRQAVNYAELDIRDIAARMVVKRDSEWFGGSSHHRWRTFLKQLDPLCVSYVRQWFDDMEWMSQVEGFSNGEPVWHMHPVIFLSSINALNLPKTPVNGELVPLDFVNFINSDSVLLNAIRNKDWLAFALRYNGPRQKGYDSKMRSNYEKK